MLTHTMHSDLASLHAQDGFTLNGYNYTHLGSCGAGEGETMPAAACISQVEVFGNVCHGHSQDQSKLKIGLEVGDTTSWGALTTLGGLFPNYGTKSKVWTNPPDDPTGLWTTEKVNTMEIGLNGRSAQGLGYAYSDHLWVVITYTEPTSRPGFMAILG